MSLNNTRRAFFVQGGAALGAGVGAAVGVSAAASANTGSSQDQVKQLQRQLRDAQDREAIRRLHTDFTRLVAGGDYGQAAELFAGPASRQFADRYVDSEAIIHTGYRQRVSHESDALVVSEDGLSATGTFHVDAELTTPVRGEFTIARMARLQGQVADRRWESGRLEARYEKAEGRWRMTSLDYLPTGAR
ncbi:MAG TPA: nuclear transport factor 2 family protein [Steroidobacteraceae bacterium]|jgi:hypothetical protein